MTLVENAGAIVGACLPALRPLVVHVRERSFSGIPRVSNDASQENTYMIVTSKKSRGLSNGGMHAPKPEDDEERLYA